MVYTIWPNIEFVTWKKYVMRKTTGFQGFMSSEENELIFELCYNNITT